LITGGGKQERGDGEDDDRLEGGGGMELMGGHRRRSTPTSDPYYGGFVCSNRVSGGTLQQSYVSVYIEKGMVALALMTPSVLLGCRPA